MVRTSAVLLALASLASLSLFTTADAKLQPAKREYDSHVYYVLEVDPDQLPLGATHHDVANLLGTEHIEQVGELKNHYLVRASVADVEGGETDGLVKRSASAGGKVDGVMRRYTNFKRNHKLDQPLDITTSDNSIDKRSLAANSNSVVIPPSAIRSLERQHPRLRAKRDTPPLPPPYTGRGALRSLRRHNALSNRQLPPADPIDLRRQTPAVASNIVAAAQEFDLADPLFPKQWHLVNGLMPQNSVNVTGVWAQGYLGAGVNVAIVDDGLDMHSDDLRPNFHAEGSWDYNDNTALPEPRLSDDQHGTRCAGEIAAAKNDVCGVGVAYEAGIAGIRILSASISDADEASALNYGYQTNDIYSCSWGPPDDGKSMEAPGRLIKKAMLNGVQNGRGGKGSIFVFASGNGGGSDDQCNFDGYTNSILSVTVGAIDRKGLHPSYSEACSANMVVTYSSGSGDNIHTTDVGKNTCTDRHGGTSAAAPIAAGIFALVLEARPELTWRDVQHLCVQTAVQVNPSDPDWQLTASGRYFNHKFGFGKLDAWAIVNAAKTWDLVKPQSWYNANLTNVNQTITAKGTVSTIEVTADDLVGANFETLEHVTFTVHLDHDRRGEVEVEVVSPAGMKSILARPRRFDDSKYGMPDWVFMSVKHWDENPVGTWTITVRDQKVNANNGVFNSWTMTLWGAAIDADLAVPYQLPSDPFDPESIAEDEAAAMAAAQEAEASALASASEAEKTATGASTRTAGGVVPGRPSKTPAPDHYEDAEEHELSATKVYAKPTAALPVDHTGDASETAVPGYEDDELPAYEEEEDDDDGYSSGSDSKLPPGTEDIAANPPTDNSADYADKDDGYNNNVDDDPDSPSSYLSSLKQLGGSTTWLFVAGGVIIVFVGAVSAFFFLRAQAARRSRGVYDFAPQDEDDFEMEEGYGKGGERGEGRTRDLFNAFAIEDSEEEGEGGEERGKAKRGFSDGATKYTDDEGEQGEEGLPEREPQTAAEREREAREHFSD